MKELIFKMFCIGKKKIQWSITVNKSQFKNKKYRRKIDVLKVFYKPFILVWVLIWKKEELENKVLFAVKQSCPF